MFGALFEVEMSKKCTPMWRDAHLQVKKLKPLQHWSTFRSCAVEKVHAVVARSTFPSQNVQSTSKHAMLGPLLEVEMLKKCTLLWREAHFKVKSAKNWRVRVRSTFGRSGVVPRGRCKGLCTLSKVSKAWKFCSMSKTMAGVGHLKRIWKDACRMAGAVQETCSSEILGGQGGDFLRWVAFWSKMTLRDRRSTSYDLASLFRGKRNNYFGDTDWKNRKTHWYEAIFEGSLAELLCFLCCQLQTLRKSCRIASFWMLSSSKIEESSQNCCVFKLKDRQIDRQLQLISTTTTTTLHYCYRYECKYTTLH